MTYPTPAEYEADPESASPLGPLVGASTKADSPIVRPRLSRFLWYCYGGSLPPENHSWVLHDVTCRTWWLRHFGRWMMVILPLLALYLTLMPTPFNIRIYTGLTFAGAIFMFSLVNIMIDTDRRAVRAGYSYNDPQRIRTTRDSERRRAANYQRRERIAERRARRGW